MPDPSFQQPASDAPSSLPDGSVPSVIPDSVSVIPDGGQPVSPDASSSVATEGVSGGAKPELPPPLTEQAVEAKVQQIRMQRLRQAEEATPEEDRERAIYELQCPWWQGFWRWTRIPDKNGWDWAQLLAVPIMLALVSWGLGEYAKSRDQQQQQADKEKAQAIADDKAKQDTLVKYLDDMAKSIEGDSSKAASGSNKSTGGGLLEAKRDSKAFIVAQSRTVLALQSLDKKRQHLVIQFLQASGLSKADTDDGDTQKFFSETKDLYDLKRSSTPEPSKKARLGLLYQAQMEKANLANSDLSGAVLIRADLRRANFGCDSSGSKEPEHCSDLSSVNLLQADLSYADLSYADLSYADLTGANLVGANLTGANFSIADLTNTYLSGFPGKPRGAILLYTDLAYADIIPEQLKADAPTDQPPLLCNVRFFSSRNIDIDPNRDCNRIPQELVKRYPGRFPDLQKAKKYVNELRQKKFQ